MTATIIVEDGSQVTGANSYITTAELSTYASDRGITISGTAEDLLIQAMDYLEGLEYLGCKLTKTQALLWPRAYVLLDGYYVDTDTIPQLLKDAQAEAALALDAGNGPLADIERKVDREKVGEIEVQYSNSSASQTIVRKISNKLRKLLSSSTSSISFKVSRA